MLANQILHTLSEELALDREKLTKLIRESPVRITMNDGRSLDVDGVETAVVSDISAAVLYRAEDGTMRMMHLPLVTMNSVEPLATIG